jgi:hypothetical protein
MKSIVLLGLFVLFLVTVQFASGKTVDEIIEKHVRASGGFDNKNAIQSIYMEGIITMMGNTNLVKIYKEQNEFAPTGFNMQWQITDEEGLFVESANSTKHVKLFDEIIGRIQTEPDITAPLLNYASLGHKALLIGKDIVDENRCYKIKLTTKTGSEINYWFSASSFLLTQSLIKNSGNDLQQKKAIRTLYSNNKAVDGITMAHSIEIIVSDLNENDPIKICLNKIEINQPFETNFLS